MFFELSRVEIVEWILLSRVLIPKLQRIMRSIIPTIDERCMILEIDSAGEVGLLRRIKVRTIPAFRLSAYVFR